MFSMRIHNEISKPTEFHIPPETLDKIVNETLKDPTEVYNLLESIMAVDTNSAVAREMNVRKFLVHRKRRSSYVKASI